MNLVDAAALKTVEDVIALKQSSPSFTNLLDIQSATYSAHGEAIANKTLD